MNRQAGDDTKTCTDCGADNPLPSQSCWLCHGDLRKNAPPIVAAQAASRRPRFVPTAGFFAILTLLVTLLLVLIGFGLGKLSIGFLPWYGIIVIPALIATTVRVGRQRMQGKEVSWTEALLTAVISGAVIHGLLALLGFALLAALFIMCLISPPRFGH